MSTTKLENLVNKTLMKHIGGMSLEELQNVAASMMGRLAHEPNPDKALDVLTELVAELQSLIMIKRREAESYG